MMLRLEHFVDRSIVRELESQLFLARIPTVLQVSQVCLPAIRGCRRHNVELAREARGSRDSVVKSEC